MTDYTDNAINAPVSVRSAHPDEAMAERLDDTLTPIQFELLVRKRMNRYLAILEEEAQSEYSPRISLGVGIKDKLKWTVNCHDRYGNETKGEQLDLTVTEAIRHKQAEEGNKLLLLE